MENIFDITNGDLLPLNINRRFINENSTAEKIVNNMRSEKVLAVDTETSDLDPHTGRLLTIQIATRNDVYVFDARKVNTDLFKNILEDYKILKILQNASFDCKFLKVKANINLHGIYDTMLAELVLTAGVSRVANLVHLVNKYLGYKISKDVRKSFDSFFDGEFSAEQIRYAADDAAVLPLIYEKQVPILKQ